MDHNRKEKLPLTERVEEAVEKVLPKRTGRGRKPAQKKEIAPQKLKLLITIVPRNKGEFFTDLLQSFEVNLQYSAVGGGTAGSDILHLMGLESNEKRVIFSLIRDDLADAALAALNEKFNTIRGGQGIAVTVPLTGVIGVSVYQFLCNHRRMIREEETE